VRTVTLDDALQLSETRARLLTRILQFLLAVLVVYGVATLRAGIAVNGGGALAVTLLPALLRREYGYSMDSGLVLWITVAVCLHSLGSLGLYEWFQWYDNITHTISATIIAGSGYAVFRAIERHSDDLNVPGEFRAIFIVVFVLAMGVFWEILEFGAEGLGNALGGGSVLVVYGIEDIASDLVFNTLGAVLVALWGTEYVDGVVAFLRTRLHSRGE